MDWNFQSTCVISVLRFSLSFKQKKISIIVGSPLALHATLAKIVIHTQFARSYAIVVSFVKYLL